MPAAHDGGPGVSHPRPGGPAGPKVHHTFEPASTCPTKPRDGRGGARGAGVVKTRRSAFSSSVGHRQAPPRSHQPGHHPGPARPVDRPLGGGPNAIAAAASRASRKIRSAENFRHTAWRNGRPGRRWRNEGRRQNRMADLERIAVTREPSATPRPSPSIRGLCHHAARTVMRKRVTSLLRCPDWRDSSDADTRTWDAAAPVLSAASATPEMLLVTSPVPVAA